MVSREDAVVTVHVPAEVGECDVAVIESSDPEALAAWLRAEGYRIARKAAPTSSPTPAPVSTVATTAAVP